METLDLFKPGENENNLIRVPKGPQFKSKGAVGLSMIFLAFFIMSIVSSINGYFLVSFICLLIGITLFSYIIDVHGIEVNRHKHLIREYKVLLWMKIGKWQNTSNFKTIYILKSNVNVPTLGYSEKRSETYHYYQIKLVDEINKNEIFLAEYNNYYKAQKIAVSIANATGLGFKDFIKGTTIKQEKL